MQNLIEKLGFDQQIAPQLVWFALLFVLILASIWLIGNIIRSLRVGLNMQFWSTRSQRPQRLAITDTFYLDKEGRRLVILRRDNTEHLLLIGGPNDVLIEANIVRATRAKNRQIFEPEPANEQMADDAVKEINARYLTSTAYADKHRQNNVFSQIEETQAAEKKSYDVDLEVKKTAEVASPLQKNNDATSQASVIINSLNSQSAVKFNTFASVDNSKIDVSDELQESSIGTSNNIPKGILKTEVQKPSSEVKQKTLSEEMLTKRKETSFYSKSNEPSNYPSENNLKIRKPIYSSSFLEKREELKRIAEATNNVAKKVSLNSNGVSFAKSDVDEINIIDEEMSKFLTGRRTT